MQPPQGGITLQQERSGSKGDAYGTDSSGEPSVMLHPVQGGCLTVHVYGQCRAQPDPSGTAHRSREHKDAGDDRDCGKDKHSISGKAAFRPYLPRQESAVPEKVYGSAGHTGCNQTSERTRVEECPGHRESGMTGNGKPEKLRQR